MNGLAMCRVRWLSHASGIFPNLTPEILSLSVVSGDTETAVENFKA